MSTVTRPEHDSQRTRRHPPHVLPHDPPQPRRASLTSQLAWPTLWGLLGVAAMSVDVPWARLIKGGYLPDEIKEVCRLAEVFGHGVGAAAILLAVWVLAPQRRPALPRVISATYLGGITANLLKLMVSRYRPFRANMQSSVFDTFQQWFPLLSAGSGGQSFPSGHSATAAGLAVGLTWMFPRGKWFFYGCAALAAMQRMASGYHFLSDTLWGAALGCLCAKACLPDGWFSSFFDRVERRLSSAGIEGGTIERPPIVGG